jgi:hypothetical protein
MYNHSLPVHWCFIVQGCVEYQGRRKIRGGRESKRRRVRAEDEERKKKKGRGETWVEYKLNYLFRTFKLISFPKLKSPLPSQTQVYILHFQSV